MAIKMRCLYYSSKSKIKSMADLIKNEFDLSANQNAVDIIPPAYSCENERLVILIISGKGDPDDVLRRFCAELDRKKAQNVALIIDGDEKFAAKITDTLQKSGANVHEKIHFVKAGLLPFMGKVSDEEKAALLSWAHGIVDNL